MQVLKTGTEMRISMNIKQHRVNRGLIYLVGGGYYSHPGDSFDLPGLL